MAQDVTQKVPLEPAPELISLEAANMADLSCPGCSISPVEE